MADTLRTDLNEFLFTPVANDSNGMHVTMLSALARSGVDPWTEAAGLAALSPEDATQKLVSMLADFPNGPLPGDATATLASCLAAQLHSPPRRRQNPIPSTATAGARDGAPPSQWFSTLPPGVRLAIYSLGAVILLAIGYQAFGG